MKRISRREFLKASAMGMGAVIVSTGLTGCWLDSDDDKSSKGALRNVAFNHGVASGDPLSDRVIIWTRVTPLDGLEDDIQVYWEVATDANFVYPVHDGRATVSAHRDYTLKVDVQNLEPGRTYYYRFRSNGKMSPTGRTKTLPTGSVSRVTLAVFSCANYPAGHFNVYGAAAKRFDFDAVVHLGDYIYEYGMGGYATGGAEAIGRALPSDNAGEILTLSDYRKRYALYRTDANLRALHEKYPFIAVWDDHEVANDTWSHGAGNHNDGEGAFHDRKMAALQAYFEWMPVRPVVSEDQGIIYRSFDFGNLVSLHMMDTRVIGRDQQLSYADYFDANGNFDVAKFRDDLTDPDRTMLGSAQLLSTIYALKNSSAAWQVLGQQVLMGRMMIPMEILQLLAGLENAINAGDMQTAQQIQAQLVPLLGELTALKMRQQANDPTLTPQELGRLAATAPYNLDAWDGYFYEREVLLTAAAQMQKKLVVLAGDTHNAWANNIRRINPDTGQVQGNPVAVEFATSSVSSPGLEEYLGLDDTNLAAIAGAETAITTLVDDLKYMNVNQRGYMVVTFTPKEARASWHFVDTIRNRDYQVDESRSKTLYVSADEFGEGLQETSS